MTAVNVWVVGFGEKAEEIRSNINKLLQASGDAHGSVTTIINADVKCAEHTDKDEPYVRVYSDDIEGAQRIGSNIFKNLDIAAEWAGIAGIFAPEE